MRRGLETATQFPALAPRSTGRATGSFNRTSKEFPYLFNRVSEEYRMNYVS